MQVALVYGGRSTEHVVSINSAKGVYPELRKSNHTVHLIGISLDGGWYLQKGPIQTEIDTTDPLSLKPGLGIFENEVQLPVEVAFATTHGFGGEDGNLQGLCQLCNIPLCGCDTLSSALGMHKDLAAKLFSDAGIPTVPSVVLDSFELYKPAEELLDKLVDSLGHDLFIKPENSGSSVGVMALKGATIQTLQAALDGAKQYSERVLVQKLIQPMVEIECAALKDAQGQLVIAGPAMVVDAKKESVGFLSYEHKYGQVDTAHLQIPSSLPPEVEQQVRSYAYQAFNAIRGDGYARIDFFHGPQGLFLNEINTSPGMTGTSHYPTLMASIGYSLQTVLDLLIEEVLARKTREKARIYTPPVL